MKVKQVYVTASDPEALGKFYQDALGLELRFADPGKWVQFSTEGAAFCIAGPSESSTEPGGNAVTIFEVDDLQVARDQAQAAGPKAISEISDGPHGSVVTLTDPAGNLLHLYQKPKK